MDIRLGPRKLREVDLRQPFPLVHRLQAPGNRAPQAHGGRRHALGGARHHAALCLLRLAEGLPARGHARHPLEVPDHRAPRPGDRPLLPGAAEEAEPDLLRAALRQDPLGRRPGAHRPDLRQHQLPDLLLQPRRDAARLQDAARGGASGAQGRRVFLPAAQPRGLGEAGAARAAPRGGLWQQRPRVGRHRHRGHGLGRRQRLWHQGAGRLGARGREGLPPALAPPLRDARSRRHTLPREPPGEEPTGRPEEACHRAGEARQGTPRPAPQGAGAGGGRAGGPGGAAGGRALRRGGPGAAARP
mmetsp:Transcript_50425/g.155954  ORF Transcript_50425/g.155954 Transcript_50425/m.155954 type:complete len:301 (-) Transcript_50425:125-1027(-)